MAASSGRSALPVYLLMAALAVAVVLVLNAFSTPRAGRPPDAIAPSPAPILDGFGSTIERDFLPTVIGRPHRSREQRYCDPRGCCPTWRTTFGTTTDAEAVIATFVAQGFETREGDREVVRGGPFPQVRWTGVIGAGSRRAWRRVEVARGSDVDRPSWPTVFVQSSAACRQR